MVTTVALEIHASVLVSAGIELIFLLIAAAFGLSRRRVLITLMFLVAAMKSRISSSFSYSGNEQVCRSWEGAQPGSEPKLANGNIPWMSCSVYEWGLARGQGAICSSRFP